MTGQIIAGTVVLVFVFLLVTSATNNANGITGVFGAISSVFVGAVQALQGNSHS